ncbi:Fic family protein [Chryseobacterium piscium]|uniref:Fic family protein n=1 Tax=Chryseobacterium piscium TaxID=333702 RepID=A0A3D9BS11_9FLAO|nr:Fic family protein [Chryseobacterium piscium]REC56267.1 Fic family protein [Chryseobacterium piscium]
MPYKVPQLPLSTDLETKKILKKVASAQAALAELKGVAASLPNVSILLNTLALQEAKDSSAVENIITTHDELFRAELNTEYIKSAGTKEVQNYALALKTGFDLVSKNNILTNSTLLEIHKVLEQNDAGYRKVPGTDLKNDKTKEIIYTPPQHGDDIVDLMRNLVNYINDDSLEDIHPLIKMAVVHHQFESIHPFYDGNGRTGRIINILYLVIKELLDYPVLYLSRYIIQNKDSYYRLLQKVRDEGAWEEWVLFILDGVEAISKQSISLISSIKKVMQDYKNYIRENYKFYSQDLLNNLFGHPYTKIEFLQDELKIERRTAAKYLNTLSEDANNILDKIKIENTNFYINTGIMNLIMNHDYNTGH